MSRAKAPDVLDHQTPEEFELAALVEEDLAGTAPFEEPICHVCRHLSTAGGMVRAGLPDGIPGEIQAGESDHRRPHPGDHGIRSEPMTPK
jgi:hypothetical protein